jgi:hypothetical protein
MNEKDFREKYYSKAQEQTLETLAGFINDMLGESLDYGSICCAVSAAALAAAWATNKAPQGGITGFQAGAIMWEFIQQWNYSSNMCGLRIINYDNMLYAQYEDKFQKIIRKEVFQSLQKEAAKLLEESRRGKIEYEKDMKQYEKDLAAFVEKYPNYHNKPKYYERLHSGTSDEWEAEKKKKESGFEFAPDKPCYFEGQTEHWQSIVNGVVPFGYEIKED